MERDEVGERVEESGTRRCWRRRQRGGGQRWGKDEGRRDIKKKMRERGRRGWRFFPIIQQHDTYMRWRGS